MNDNFGYFLVTRNNPEMIREWGRRNYTDNSLVLSLDESTDPAQRANCRFECDKFGFSYAVAESGGLGQNLKQAAEFFLDRNVDNILYMQHDAYPESRESIEKLNLFIKERDFSDFGLAGFNVVHGRNEILRYKIGSGNLHTLARSPLEKGNGYYAPEVQSRLNYAKVLKIPFAIESAMWTTVLISCETVKNVIRVDSRFIFFHAWDDIAFQMMQRNRWNFVIPDITFMHDQDIKKDVRLPENSPIPFSNGRPREYFYGPYDHLQHWYEKWRFRWDFRKHIETIILPRRIRDLSGRAFGKIEREFGVDLRNNLETVSRHDFSKTADLYHGTILMNFFEHDPKNGALKYFPELSLSN